MTIKDFFKIIIKLFALYSATIAIFSLLPTYIGYAINSSEFGSIILALGVVVITVALLIVLIFGAEKIVNILKLDKGFDENRIDFGNIKEITILKTAIIVIAGLLIIDNFPLFLNHCFFLFKNLISKKEVGAGIETFVYGKADYFQFFTAILSILIGYLMITNYTGVANWLSKIDKKNRG
ncbi:hypothetical protein [Aquimarina sp. SS2-1]|uniref:hypothetical protein n=1 Tax=Aquimarina besae TaxID=3342247 RepID=UPI00367302A3